MMILFVTARTKTSQAEVIHGDFGTRFCVDPYFGQNGSISCTVS